MNPREHNSMGGLLGLMALGLAQMDLASQPLRTVSEKRENQRSSKKRNAAKSATKARARNKKQ